MYVCFDVHTYIYTCKFEYSNVYVYVYPCVHTYIFVCCHVYIHMTILVEVMYMHKFT